MDEMKSKDAFGFTQKADSGNIYSEIMEELRMEEFNSGKTGFSEIEIASSKLTNSNRKLVPIHGDTGDECTKESNLVIGGKEEKEKLEVDSERTSFEPTKLNGEESIVIPGTKEKEGLAKESDEIILMDEETEIENANDGVVHEEDIKEKNEGAVKVISKKKKPKLNQKEKKVLKKKIAVNGTDKVTKDTNDLEPLNKENTQTMVELNNKENDDNEVVHQDGAKQEVKNAEPYQKIFKKKISKPRKQEKRGLKKKIALKGVNEVVNKSANDVEASNKKTHKKDNIAGMIFMCSSKTKKDCYHYKVLGLPSSKRDVVLKICEGMKLFLFDVTLKLLYGIYKAAGPGGYNIEPKAFKSAFPSQVRFNVYEDCLSLPEKKFKKVIKDNYYKKNKFDCQLTSEQVKNLCKLFQAASKGSKFEGLHWDLGVETRNPRCKARGGDRSETFGHRNRKRKSHPLPSEPWARRDDRSVILADRDRSRKRHRGAASRTFEDWDRTRKRHHDAYEREIYASAVTSASSRPLLPPSPAAITYPPRSYPYERTLNLTDYHRDPFVEHQGRRFQDLDLSHQEHIELRRHLSHEHHDGRFLDSELRPRRREIEHRDPPVYRDRPLYDDHAYPASHPSEYHTHPRTSLRRSPSPQKRGLYYRYIY